MKLTRLLLLPGLALLSAFGTYAQEDAVIPPVLSPSCADCKNIAPDGNMASIPTSGQGYLNTFGLHWKSSHGSPSYSPGSLWMWSYNNNGEGVYYDGVTFLAGHAYCITFDIGTRTHDGSAPNPGAGLNVVATNSMVPMESTSGGAPIPPIPGASEMVANENWSWFPNPGTTTLTYIFTPSSNWSQLWFFPHSSTLPQVELTLTNLRVCDISAPSDPCDYEAGFEYIETGDCYKLFSPYINLGPNLSLVQVHWDFGDGTTSTNIANYHYYSSPGMYTVKMTLLTANSNGECCAREFVQEIWVEKTCNPCKMVDMTEGYLWTQSGNNVTFMASGPDADGFAYVWYFGDGTTGSGLNPSHTYSGPGWYIVQLTTYYYNAATGTCCHADRFMEVYISPNGGPVISNQLDHPNQGHQRNDFAPTEIPEMLKERPLKEEKVMVFPNPSTGIFTITSRNTADLKLLEVYGMDGRLVKTVNASGLSTTIDLQGQDTGAYELKVTLTNGETYTSKLVRH